MHSSSYKACKGTVLNQAYHSVNRGYPQIPLILMCSTHLQEEWLKFISSPRLLNAPSPIKRYFYISWKKKKFPLSFYLPSIPTKPELLILNDLKVFLEVKSGNVSRNVLLVRLKTLQVKQILFWNNYAIHYIFYYKKKPKKVFQKHFINLIIYARLVGA